MSAILAGIIGGAIAMMLIALLKGAAYLIDAVVSCLVGNGR